MCYKYYLVISGLKAPSNPSPGPGPSSSDVNSNQGDDIGSLQSGGAGPGGVVQMKDIPVLQHVNVGKNDNSSGGKFTTSNFVESVVTPSESVFGEASKSSSKKRKKDDGSVSLGGVVGVDEPSKKFKAEIALQQVCAEP